MIYSAIKHFLYKCIESKARPVIVVGMNRSGTSLLAGLLEKCGVWLGQAQDHAHESLFFREINKAILEHFDCGWGCRRCFDFYPSVKELLAEYVWIKEKMKRRLKDGFVDGYAGSFGIYQLLLGTGIWGWKDPKNSLTLPLWYAMFPHAAVIHIYRDGRDVAFSMSKLRSTWTQGKLLPQRGNEIERFLEDFQIWELYVNRIREALDLFDIHHTIRYEHLLASPETELSKLVDIVGLHPQRPVKEICSIVDPTRAYRNRSEEVAWVHKLPIQLSLLHELGYE